MQRGIDYDCSDPRISCQMDKEGAKVRVIRCGSAKVRVLGFEDTDWKNVACGYAQDKGVPEPDDIFATTNKGE